MTQWGLDTLFNPAKRFMDEEKRRLQSTREEVGDNSGGKRIDLESGKVRIAPRKADEASADAGSDATTDAATDATADSAASSADSGTSKRSGAAKKTPSAAAIRAAERRGRTPR